MKPAGRIAVVSGASSGIGEATAKALAKRGAHIALIARTASDLERVAARIRAEGGSASTYPVDLSDGGLARQAAHAIAREVGPPDILVNSAGAGRWLYAEETDPSEAVTMMALPYFAAFYLTSAFLPAMLERRSGRIVNVDSPAAFSPWPGSTGYAAARWALRGFTEALRVDLHKTGVGVTHVVAGEVTSGYWDRNPGTRQRLPSASKLFPTLTPEQVADAIVHGIERNSANVIVPFALRVALSLNQLWPWPMNRLMIATGWHRDKVAGDQRPQAPPGGPPEQM